MLRATWVLLTLGEQKRGQVSSFRVPLSFLSSYFVSDSALHPLSLSLSFSHPSSVFLIARSIGLETWPDLRNKWGETPSRRSSFSRENQVYLQIVREIFKEERQKRFRPCDADRNWLIDALCIKFSPLSWYFLPWYHKCRSWFWPKVSDSYLVILEKYMN